MDDKTKQLECYKNELSKVKDANFQLLKKLNKLEHDHIEESSEANEKIVSLQTQIVKLRSENEKTSVGHQDLELQLARSKKECREFERSLLAKDQQLKNLSQKTEERTKELLKLLEEKTEEYTASKEAFSLKEEELFSKIDELNHIVKCKREEISLLENELEKIRSNYDENNQQLEHVKESAGILKADNSDLETKLKDYDREVKTLREDRTKWKEEKDTVFYKVHRLEECLEAERTAHLESKYNAELVQLRLNQSEKSNAEFQSRLDEANQIIDTLTCQLKDTETALTEEAKYARQYRQDLDRVKSDHENQKTISDLKIQVQKNTELTNALQENSNRISELQRQLKQANKKSDIIAAEKDVLLQEIQVLLESYYNIPAVDNSVTDTNSKKDKKGRHLMDQLKTLIQSQRKRLQETSEEMDKLTRNVEQISREFQSSKDQSIQRDKDLKEAQNLLATANQELNQFRSRLVDQERKVADLRAANSDLKRAIEKEKQSTSVLHEEITRLKKIRKNELHDRDQVARLLYSRLTRVGCSLDTSTDDKPEREKPPKVIGSKSCSRGVSTGLQSGNGSKQINWPQMKAALIEGLTLLVEALMKHQREVERMKAMISDKDKLIAELEHEKTHQQEQLDDLNASYNKQKQELTKRFVKAVESTSLKTKKKESRGTSNQRNPSSVDDNVICGTSSDSNQRSFESEHSVRADFPPVGESSYLPQTMSILTANNEKVLLVSVALLTSMYFPLKEKAEQLARERAVLSNLLYKYYSYNYCSRLRSTARTVHLHIHDGKLPLPNRKDNLSKLNGIFRFRIVVIQVIAANRFNKLSRKRQKSSSVQPIIITPRTPRVGAPLSHLSLDADTKNTNLWLQRASKWMTSSTLIEIVNDSFNELLPYLSSSSSHSSQFPNILQGCLTKFICETKDQLFSHSSAYHLFETTTRAGSSRLWDDENNEVLHVRLGEGLVDAIKRFKDRALLTPKAVASYLDRSVTQLCKDLQTSKLCQEEMKAKIESLSGRCQRLENDNSNVSRLQESLSHSVPKEKFDTLMERYQKITQEASDAKQLLNEQAYEIQSLSSQMDLLAESEKEFVHEVRELKEALAETQAELCVCKEELTARENSSELTYRQNNQLENRLKTSDRQVLRLQKEFDSCLSYLSAVIHSVSPHLSGQDLPTAEEFLTQESNLTDSENDTHSSESSILIASRNVVRTLLAQYGLRLERNLKSAQDQIADYRNQVAAAHRDEKVK